MSEYSFWYSPEQATRHHHGFNWPGVGVTTVYPKKYAHGFVVLCFVVVMQSFIMNSHEVFIHIHQGCFAGTGAIVRLPQCQWSKPDGNGQISQCITTTKHSKAKTVCIFLRIYCKPIFSVPLFSHFIRVIKTLITCMISQSELTGAAAAELQRHLANMRWLRVYNLYFCLIKISKRRN